MLELNLLAIYSFDPKLVYLHVIARTTHVILEFLL
jgi:hypothetical protein